MITRRHFLKVFGGTIGLLATGISSLAHATYNKAYLYMSDFGGLIRKPIKGFTDDNAEAQAIIKRQEP